MKASRKIAAALALVFIISVLTVSVQAAPGIQGKKQDAKTPVKSGMPKEIAAIIQEGLATRQGRQDFAFAFSKQIILPALQNNFYPVFVFKAKNGDLGYAPAAAGTGEMEVNLNVFFQFFQPAEDGTIKPWVAGKSLALLKTTGEGYSAEKEDWYSFGLGMTPGKYILAMVLASPDMKKLSVGYSDINLPGPEAYPTALWSTEPIIISALEQVEPDQRPTVHRGCLSWGALQLVPNMAAELASGQNIEILFGVFGATLKDPAAPQPLLDLEVTYEVQDEAGKPAVKWAPQGYQSSFVSQPLPLEQNLQKMDEKGTVLSTEKKPLGAGKYTLVIAITDKVSGKKGETRLPFSVK